MLFRRATKVNSQLLDVSSYWSLRRLEPEENRQASVDTAQVLAVSIADESQLLRIINEEGDGVDKERAQQLLADDSVVDALTRIFTVRSIYQRAMLKESTERVMVLDEVFRALDSSPLAESPKALPRLIRDASRRLKAVRQELAASDYAEAENAVYAELFPKKLSLSELLRLGGIVLAGYALGSYLFTFTVFKRLQSKVVGLEPGDYLQFATTHTFWVLPFILFGAWVALPENISRAKQTYLSAEYGVAPKRYTSSDISMYVILAWMNIPVFLRLLGIEIEGRSWTHVVLIDGLLLLLFVVKQIPFQRLFEHWYATHITVLFAVILWGQMGWHGWVFAEELKEPSSTDWQYQFDDIEVTSDDYSFVYEGDSSVIFYERDSGKFLVKDTEAVKSFVGNL